MSGETLELFQNAAFHRTGAAENERGAKDTCGSDCSCHHIFRFNVDHQNSFIAIVQLPQ
jgi:hypothetical protein